MVTATAYYLCLVKCCGTLCTCRNWWVFTHGFASHPQRTVHVGADALLCIVNKCITSSINVNNYTQAPSDHKESTLAFHHADTAWKTTVDSVMDPTRDFGYVGDADLKDFLQRPVKILDQDWTVTAGSVQQAINPWTLFLENTQVRDRIEGYRLLQGKLHLRITLNGGPFYYGHAIAAYMPRQTYNDHSFGAPNGAYYTAQLSLLPHIYLDPTSSEGGEIVCPFLCPDNWIDLVGGTYKHMGILHINSYNDLLHANSSTGKVNISVYAWMDDARVAAPTSANFSTFTAHAGDEYVTTGTLAAVGAGFVALVGAILAGIKCSYRGLERQSSHEEHTPHAGDEYGTGIISKPASVVAKMAGMLTSIPLIKPFARPTELVAGAVGRIAHVFGYSRPAIISDLTLVKNRGVGNLANTDAHEAVHKLSLDSKQELSIDPRTVGLSDVDEMAFDYIKSKEMYVTTFTWDESDVSGALLGELAVGPDYHIQETINTYPLNLLAPMNTVSVPFTFWRGSIKFRFQLAASQLHRGRYRIIYDPYEAGSGVDDNQVYSRIVDLSTNRDFEMVVSWNCPKSWLRYNDRFGGVSTSYSPNYTFSPLVHNGSLRIEVVNELTSPSPALSQPVYLNVYVSAGPDFEVACPTDSVLEDLEFEPQSGFEPHSGEENEELIDEQDGIPESPQSIMPVGVPAPMTDPSSHIFHGEVFRSIRSLLKRYCYHSTLMLGEFDTRYVIDSVFPIEPGKPRYPTNATITPSPQNYEYSTMTYLNWFTPCYVGWRGSLRSKFLPMGRSDMNIIVRRFAEPLAMNERNVYARNLDYNNVGTSANIREMLKVGAGHAAYICNSDGAAEVDFPFYSPQRFAPARRFLDGTGSGGNEWLGENAGFMMAQVHVNGSGISRFVAAGDDFSLFMFVGQPGVYRRPARPTNAASIDPPPY